MVAWGFSTGVAEAVKQSWYQYYRGNEVWACFLI